MNSAVETSSGGERGHDEQLCSAFRRSRADPGRRRAAAGGWLPWLSLGTGVVLAIVGGDCSRVDRLRRLSPHDSLTVLGGAVNVTGLLAYAAYGLRSR
jgi:hypothetical protein